MSDANQFVLGDWVMRRGDRLPLLSLAVEDDEGHPVNLTGATVWLQLRAEDGGDPIELPPEIPRPALVNGWLKLQMYVHDPVNGIVVYDWPDLVMEGLRVGIDEMVVQAIYADGSHLSAPTDRTARLNIRPNALPT